MLGFFAALALVQEQPLPKIAEVDSAGGTVEIISPKGTVRRPVRFGTRWKNAEIRDEDRIKTAEGSQAVILFPDASKFTLKEKSEIQILQKKLPKPTAQGNTVGRRVKVIVGDLISEVIPSKDVRTDFEMPAGSAAVRGTRLRLTVADGAATLTTSDGEVRFTNGKYSTRIDVKSGQAIRVEEGSLKVTVLEDNGETLLAKIGDKVVTLTADDLFVLSLSGADISFDIQQGTLGVNGTETSQDQTCAPDATIGEDAANFDPTAETAGALPEGDVAPSDLIGLDGTGDSTGGVDLGSTATNVGTSGTAATTFTDTFERANDLLVGNGWIEFLEMNPGGTVSEIPGVQEWAIDNGAARLDYAGGAAMLEGIIRQPIGHLSTFEAKAEVEYFSFADSVTIVVNHTSGVDSGMFLDYFPGSAQMDLEGAAGLFSFSSVTVSSGTHFFLELTYDGSQLCGSLHNAAGLLLDKHWITTGNTPGGDFNLEGAIQASGGSVHFHSATITGQP